MSRTLYLVAYDIANARRLARVRKCLAAYRVGGQKSVPECWLTPGELRDLHQRLEDLINHAEDKIFMLQLDPRSRMLGRGQAKEFSGHFMIV